VTNLSPGESWLAIVRDSYMTQNIARASESAAASAALAAGPALRVLEET
jgi:hypothetical protein